MGVGLLGGIRVCSSSEEGLADGAEDHKEGTQKNEKLPQARKAVGGIKVVVCWEGFEVGEFFE